MDKAYNFNLFTQGVRAIYDGPAKLPYYSIGAGYAFMRQFPKMAAGFAAELAKGEEPSQERLEEIVRAGIPAAKEAEVNRNHRQDADFLEECGVKPDLRIGRVGRRLLIRALNMLGFKVVADNSDGHEKLTIAVTNGEFVFAFDGDDFKGAFWRRAFSAIAFRAEQ